jgi:UDP-glucose 4-epimerase
LGITAALTKAVVRIFGTDHHTPDETCVRDYIDVSDIADAHLRALDHLLRGGKSFAVNLANARGYSGEGSDRSRRENMWKLYPHGNCPRRPGDPPLVLGDSSRCCARTCPAAEQETLLNSLFEQKNAGDRLLTMNFLM